MKLFVTCIILTITPFVFSACSITKPCAEGGDITWNPPIVGDKKCTIKRNKEGKNILHGSFKQEYFSTHTIALEGQYDEGRKTGIWTYYGEDGKLKSVKYFDSGVEKTPPAEAQKKIDLIIQQKNGGLNPRK